MIALMLGFIVLTFFLICAGLWIGAIVGGLTDLFRLILRANRWVVASVLGLTGCGAASLITMLFASTTDARVIGPIVAIAAGFLGLWIRSTPAQRSKLEHHLRFLRE